MESRFLLSYLLFFVARGGAKKNNAKAQRNIFGKFLFAPLRIKLCDFA